MARGETLFPTSPNAALGFVYRRFFDHIEVSDAWVSAVRDAASKGPVVYVLRSESIVDVLALEYLVSRFDLPKIRFAQDTQLFFLEPVGKSWVEAVSPGGESVEERIRRAFLQGGSAVLFLKRAAAFYELSKGARMLGKSEGDDALRALFRIQREQGKPILLVPQTFIWSRRPDTRGTDLIDTVFGSREYPGKIRTVMQFLLNYRHADFRAGEVLDLKAFLREARASEGDDTLVRRLTYALLTRLERERRGILGPAQKPWDRVREEVLRSPRLQSVINEMAGEGEAERLLMNARAYRMLDELTATPSHEGQQALKVGIEAITSRIFSGVEVDDAGLERVRELTKQGTVVFLPSHKSHFDYILLSYVLDQAHIQLPLIAAGDNLSFFPMGPIFRRGGAFFIRRSFKGDRLYAAVVDAYIRRMLRDGWSIEFFLEGGRSRTGKLLSPKFGLLGFVVDAALSLPDRTVTFVPVNIGYERVVEERSYLRELSGGEKRKEDARALVRGAKVLESYYGRVSVQFGEPLTLSDVRREVGLREGALPEDERKLLSARLGHAVMAEINRVTSVTPGAVVAMVLLEGGRRGVPHPELEEMVRCLVKTLGRWGARMASGLLDESGSLRPGAVREATQMFVRGELARAFVPGEGDAGKAPRLSTLSDDVVYTVPDDRRLALSYSKNQILHFFVARSLVATAIGSSSFAVTGEPIAEASLRDRVQALSRLFKFEFMFRADAPFEEIFNETLSAMIDEGELSVSARPNAGPKAPRELSLGAGHDGLDAEAWLRFYADLLTPFLGSYLIAARAMALLLKGPMSRKDVLRKAMAVGERMFLSGEISRREAICRPVIENAVTSLVDRRYVAEESNKLSLSPSFDTGDTVGLIEARIRAFVVTGPFTTLQPRGAL